MFDKYLHCYKTMRVDLNYLVLNFGWLNHLKRKIVHAWLRTRTSSTIYKNYRNDVCPPLKIYTQLEPFAANSFSKCTKGYLNVQGAWLICCTIWSCHAFRIIAWRPPWTGWTPIRHLDTPLTALCVEYRHQNTINWSLRVHINLCSLCCLHWFSRGVLIDIFVCTVINFRK